MTRELTKVKGNALGKTRGDFLQTQDYAGAPALLRSRIVGLGRKSFKLLSLLIVLGFGYNLHQQNKLMQERVESLAAKSSSLESSLAQKDSIIASQNKALEKLEKEKALASDKQAPVQVINNINLGQNSDTVGQKKTFDREPASLGTERFYATESLIRPEIKITQLPLRDYVDGVRPNEAKDYRDLLHRIQIERNRFMRHQSADTAAFSEYRNITGSDQLEWHRFRERQTEDRHELGRMFDKISEAYRNKRRVTFSVRR